MSTKKELKAKAVKLFQLEREMQELQEEANALRNFLIEGMTENDVKLIELGDFQYEKSAEPEAIVVKLNERTTITYNLEKLKERLEPEVLKQFVDKDYFVNDFKALVDMAKKYEIPKKEFLTLVKSIETINRAKLARLYDVGEITIKDIKGCYNVSVSRSVKISSAKRA